MEEKVEEDEVGGWETGREANAFVQETDQARLRQWDGEGDITMGLGLENKAEPGVGDDICVGLWVASVMYQEEGSTGGICLPTVMHRPLF